MCYKIKIVIAVSFIMGCGGSSPQINKTVELDTIITPSDDVSGGGSKVEQSLEEVHFAIEKHDLWHYPDLTFMLFVQDIPKAISEINKKKGAKVVYDPNMGTGHDIPFLIVKLPPKAVQDTEFIKNIGLKSLGLDHPMVSKIEPKGKELFSKDLKYIYVPVEDVKVPELRKRAQGRGLGENTIVAVIDTGVDASHPIFQDRVIYSVDQTQEGHVDIQQVDIKDEKIEIHGKVVDLPEKMKAQKTVYAGIINEASLGAQFNDGQKTKDLPNFDLNRNGQSQDQFVVLVSQTKDSYMAFVDVNGDGKFNKKELSPVMDFNWVRASKTGKHNENAFLSFPSRNRTLKYPVNFISNKKGEIEKISIVIDFSNHGTHVAGIIAGHGEKIKGAAPKAKIMAQKVCSGITCTNSAILRGLVDTFYNPYGYVPDIVNISLGSHEGYQQDVLNYLIRDLSAKFGTTFFISASNSGPGYRSLNSIGSFGPTVQIGAHVSKAAISSHYPISPGIIGDLSDHNLLFFSSVGPSYTGQLRPNVVAPGSAISANSMIGGKAAMYNGTSMSSPLAAGAAAALISLAKTEKEFQKLEAVKFKKIESLGIRSDKGSLIEIPLALRAALEDSADPLNYTMAQVGHGLINIDRAYKSFLKKVAKVNSKEIHFFELKVNDNAKDKRLYDRNYNIPSSKKVTLSLENDGETSDIFVSETLLNEPTEVHLRQVEVQDFDGQIQTLNEKLPFEMAVEGTEQGTRFKNLDFMEGSKSRKNSFYSVRKLDRMESGKTYLATYDVFQRNQRVFTFLDVVHKPLILPNTKTKIYTPGISAAPLMKRAALSRSNVKIKSNGFHRYPIQITERDSQLQVQLAISASNYGSVYVQLYDPDGKEQGFDVVKRSNQIPAEKTLATVSVDTRNKPGIYELVVNGGNRGWMGPTRYDFFVQAHRLKPSKELIELKSENSSRLVLANSGSQVEKLEGKLGPFTMMESKRVKVLPSHWSYSSIELPKGASTLMVSFEKGDWKDSFLGRIDHRLYKYTENGFVPVAKASTKDFDNDGKIFDGLSSDEKLFFAVETFNTVPDNQDLSKSLTDVPVEILFPQFTVKPIDVTRDLGLSLIESVEGENDVFILDFKSKMKVLNSFKGSVVMDGIGDTPITMTLPVYLKP